MAIQQHPLPQDISNYRFRLIGDMTIKQFASLGISIVLAIAVYSTPLPFFFKYPLSFVFVVLGVGMAFVPVQGRSLDVWIIAFIKSIYSPTQYSWKRTAAENITTDTLSPSVVISNLSTPTVSSARIELIQPKPAPVSPTPIASLVIPATEPESIQIVPKSDISNLPSISPISQLPVPFTPTTPNTLVGLTITPDNRILDGVMVEIKKGGLTIRATKSNKLGQFMFARPLENGMFQILAEKDGFQFSPYSLELTGEIVRPLKIQATT